MYSVKYYRLFITKSKKNVVRIYLVYAKNNIILTNIRNIVGNRAFISAIFNKKFNSFRE